MIRLAIVATTATCCACSPPPDPAAANISTKAPASLSPGTHVSIRFNPPLDTPLRYRLAQGAAAGQGLFLTMVVRFTRSETGYRMSSSLEIPPSAARDPMAQLAARPVLLDLDPGGAITRIVDEEAWVAAGDALVRQDRDSRRSQAVLAFLRHYRTLPLSQRITIFARSQLPIIRFATFDAAVGADRTVEGKGGSGQGPVRQRVDTILHSVENGRAAIGVRQQFSTEQVRAIMGQASRSTGISVPPDVAARPVVIGTAAIVDISTGLADSYEQRIISGAEGEPGGNAPLVILERVRE